MANGPAPVRDHLLAAVRAAPGLHTSRLALLVGLTPSACGHHLRHLERDCQIVALEDRGRRCWFGRRRAVAAKHGVCLLRRPGTRRVADRLLAAPGEDLGAVAKATGQAATCAQRRLAALAEAGLVLRVPVGRSIQWFPAQALQEAMDAADAAPALPGEALVAPPDPIPLQSPAARRARLRAPQRPWHAPRPRATHDANTVQPAPRTRAALAGKAVQQAQRPQPTQAGLLGAASAVRRSGLPRTRVLCTRAAGAPA